MDLIKKLRLWRGLAFFLRTRPGARLAQLFRALVNRLSSLSTRSRGNQDVPWAPFEKPLADSTICVVSTAGLYLEGDPPFDIDSAKGDASFRVIPSDFDKERIRIAHAHYPQQRAKKDINVLLPIDRLRELVDAQVLGGLAPNFYSFGFGAGLSKEYVDKKSGTAYELARHLVKEEVDFVLMVPA